jgi:sodium-dependent dicarboxylate transporter 2/3/5
MTARWKVWLGPAACAVVAFVASAAGLSSDQGLTLAAAAWMLVWWISEAVPIAVTSLLPIVLFPALGLMGVGEATVSFGSHYVFLFLGGFLIALALEKWNLHERLALWVLLRAGNSRRRLVGGFMVATALLSMWISNTATTLMMLPIALSVISQVPSADGDRFPLALLLGTAYAANIGGFTTLVGTPPNVAMAGIYFEQTGSEVPFFAWMLFAFPLGVVLLFAVHAVLTRWLIPVTPGAIGTSGTWFREQLERLGAVAQAERRVGWVFGLTALLWMLRRPLNEGLGLNLDDTGIAMAGGLVLFLVRSERGGGARLLEWKDTQRLPWDILLLFGGGLTLARALGNAGLIEALAHGLAGAESWPWWAVAAVLTAMGLLLTEVMSNLALTVVFVPVVIELAESLGLPPLLFAVPLTLASSCAFMLPMATPPNAIVFGSGKVRIRDMARAGMWLNGLAILLIVAISWLALRPWMEAFC